MDSISREGLLALLRAKPLTQKEIIDLVKLMSPVEIDSTDPPSYMGLGVSPDLMNWPASILMGLG